MRKPERQAESQRSHRHAPVLQVHEGLREHTVPGWTIDNCLRRADVRHGHNHGGGRTAAGSADRARRRTGAARGTRMVDIEHRPCRADQRDVTTGVLPAALTGVAHVHACKPVLRNRTLAPNAGAPALAVPASPETVLCRMCRSGSTAPAPDASCMSCTDALRTTHTKVSQTDTRRAARRSRLAMRMCSTCTAAYAYGRSPDVQKETNRYRSQSYF
jgi:hypothetical protein